MSRLTNTAAIGLAALLLAGTTTAPAMAQPYRDYQRDQAYQRDQGYQRGQGNREYRGEGRASAGRNLTSSYVDSLEWRINNAVQEGRLPRYEARRLISELRQIQGPAIFRVENGRASGWEIRRVSNVVDRIEAATQGYAPNRRDDRYSYRDH